MSMHNSLLLPCIHEFSVFIFLNRIQCLTSYSPMTFDPNFTMIAGMHYPPPIPGPVPGPTPCLLDKS